jgi:protein TonB
MKKLAWPIFLSAAVHAAILIFPDAFRREPPEAEMFPVVLLVEKKTQEPDGPAKNNAQRMARQPALPPSSHLYPPEPATSEKVMPASEPELPRLALAPRSAPSFFEEDVQRAAEPDPVGASIAEAEVPPKPIIGERFAALEPERPSPDNTGVRVAVAAKVTVRDFSPDAPRTVKVRYAFTPAPDYPKEARSQEWEGQVLLRVFVSPEGLPERIEVSRGSGFSVLDGAAVRSVRRWKFHPAREGGEPVATWIKIPVDFKLAAAEK